MNSEIKKPLPPFNKKFASILGELSVILQRKGDPFKARAYKKAEETIYTFEGDINEVEQLKGKPGIGVAVLKKMQEYVDTGKIKFLEKEKEDPVNIFTQVHGIGIKKAEKIVEDGIKTIEELRENQDKLNNIQKKGLKYYEDLQKRIPREEIDSYKNLFDDEFKKLKYPNATFEIVGSYRRGVSNSGDIDVIISDKENDNTIFSNFIKILLEKNVVTELLSNGKTKSMAIGKLPGDKAYRRIDFLYSSPKEYPFSILYFTGSKAFNTTMRAHALKNSLSLNEHGLYKMEGKKKGELLDLDLKTEKDIFDYLKLKYVEPVNRKDYTSIKPYENKNNNKKEDNNEKSDLNNNANSKGNKEQKAENIEQPENELEVNLEVNNKLKAENKNEKKNNQPKNGEVLIKVKKKIKKGTLKKSSKENNKANNKPQSKKMTKQRLLSIKVFYKKFKEEGIKYVEKSSEEQLEKIIKEANKLYYNENPIFNDNEYDIVKEYMEEKYPNNKILAEIGAPVPKKEKVNLPYFMGSMDKLKSEDAVNKWIEKYPSDYIISAKLDGVSGLYSTENGIPKLYTRGNGKVGQDVTHLIPYLKLPQDLGLTIRGEFIIEKQIFDQFYKADFANPRNFVSGIINSKTINKDKLKHIDFVAYEVITPVLPIRDQIKLLSSKQVECVLSEEKDILSVDFLSKLLVSWRETYKYEIDGIIITHNKVYERKEKNPEYAFAFKMILTEQIAEAKVVHVIWNPSKDGYLKPKIQIEPIHLGGVKIEYATAFNAKFIEDKKLGIGAIVKIIRSGDVIPYIMEVTQPATEIKFPDVPYYWNDTHIDIILENSSDNSVVLNKNITMFFTTLNVKQLSEGNVKRIINSGYSNVPAILKMSVGDFLKVEGFKDKTSENIFKSIQEKVNSSSLSTFMVGSNVFGHGFGKKKFDIILKAYPNILTDSIESNIIEERLLSVKGIALKTAKDFCDKKDKFVEFMKDCDLHDKLIMNTKNISLEEIDDEHVLFEKNIVFTGFRDKELIDLLEKKYSAKITSTVNSKTFALVVKDISEDNSKIKKATELKKPVYTKDDFVSKFNL
jgi:DNA ligase (NAD+)